VKIASSDLSKTVFLKDSDCSVEQAGSSPGTTISYEQWEIIEFCVRLTRLFGIPKSVGEIFGFIFSSSAPVTFDTVVASLGISNGSASQGLRFLRQVGALKLAYVARDRRDFYVAETSARRLLAGFLSENVLQEVSENRQRLVHLHAHLSAENDLRNSDLLGRVELLMNWSQQGANVLKAAMEILS
jgi:DNA-binding transcriptional regulator GbsR (MarR family)